MLQPSIPLSTLLLRLDKSLHRLVLDRAFQFMSSWSKVPFNGAVSAIKESSMEECPMAPKSPKVGRGQSWDGLNDRQLPLSQALQMP
jgi:hypothetical protein